MCAVHRRALQKDMLHRSVDRSATYAIGPQEKRSLTAPNDAARRDEESEGRLAGKKLHACELCEEFGERRVRGVGLPVRASAVVYRGEEGLRGGRVVPSGHSERRVPKLSTIQVRPGESIADRTRRDATRRTRERGGTVTYCTVL